MVEENMKTERYKETRSGVVIYNVIMNNKLYARMCKRKLTNSKTNGFKYIYAPKDIARPGTEVTVKTKDGKILTTRKVTTSNLVTIPKIHDASEDTELEIWVMSNETETKEELLNKTEKEREDPRVYFAQRTTQLLSKIDKHIEELTSLISCNPTLEQKRHVKSYFSKIIRKISQVYGPAWEPPKTQKQQENDINILLLGWMVEGFPINGSKYEVKLGEVI